MSEWVPHFTTSVFTAIVDDDQSVEPSTLHTLSKLLPTFSTIIQLAEHLKVSETMMQSLRGTETWLADTIIPPLSRKLLAALNGPLEFLLGLAKSVQLVFESVEAVSHDAQCYLKQIEKITPAVESLRSVTLEPKLMGQVQFVIRHHQTALAYAALCEAIPGGKLAGISLTSGIASAIKTFKLAVLAYSSWFNGSPPILNDSGQNFSAIAKATLEQLATLDQTMCNYLNRRMKEMSSDLERVSPKAALINDPRILVDSKLQQSLDHHRGCAIAIDLPRPGIRRWGVGGRWEASLRKKVFVFVKSCFQFFFKRRLHKKFWSLL